MGLLGVRTSTHNCDSLPSSFEPNYGVANLVLTFGAAVARMAGFGHLLVYAVGALDLKAILGNFLGDTQSKKVCVIAALAMTFAQFLSAWATQERVLVSDGYLPLAVP